MRESVYPYIRVLPDEFLLKSTLSTLAFFSRGRDRALALQYDQNHGCFTHRCEEVSSL